MAFYDELRKKLHKTGKGTLERTKSATEIVRLNSAISDLEKEIADIFTELGKAYYNKNAKNPQSDLIQYFDVIESKTAQIKEYKDQILVLKGVTECPHCGRHVDINAIYCSFCGQRLIQEEIEPEVGQRCSYCGQPLAEEDLFCTKCGRKVEALQPIKIEKRICVRCGKELAPDALFCYNCGQPSEVSSGASMITPNLTEDTVQTPESGVINGENTATMAVAEQNSTEPVAAHKIEIPQDYSDKEEREEPKDVISAEQVQSGADVKTVEQVTEEHVVESETGKRLNQESDSISYITLCEKCGSRLEPGDMFCPNCGHKVNGQQTAIDMEHDSLQSEENAENEVTPVCPKCGAEIEDDALFCAECGYKLG